MSHHQTTKRQIESISYNNGRYIILCSKILEYIHFYTLYITLFKMYKNPIINVNSSGVYMFMICLKII